MYSPSVFIPSFLLWIPASAPRLNIRIFRLHITQYLGVMRVSQFSAAVIILLLLLSIPHPCISKRRRWRNGEEEVVNGRLDEWYFASQFLPTLSSYQSKTSVATGRHNAFRRRMLWGQCSIHAAPGLSPRLG